MGGSARTLEVHAGPDGATAEAEVERLVGLVRRLLERTAQLEHALSSRIAIEQAKGVLAERYGTDTEAAFELLRRAARNNRMQIHQLAACVAPGASTPPEIEDVVAP